MISDTAFPLTALDVNFLLSSDLKKLDLPNSITIHSRLKKALIKEQLVTVLVELDNTFPKLKLATRFDEQSLSWVQIQSSKSEFFGSLVAVQNEKVLFIDEILSQSIQKANYDVPFEILLQDEYVFFRQNHIFGDGMYAMKLVELIFTTYFEGIGAVENTPIAEQLTVPMLKGSRFFSPNLSPQKASEGQKDFHVHFQPIDPTSFAKSQSVHTFILDSDQLHSLDKLREKLSGTVRVSINTLLNVLFSYFFNQKNKQNSRTYLSIPTHLSAYVDDKIYPYNFLTNIDVYLDTPNSLQALKTVVQQTQTEISRIQKSGQLLTNVIGSFEEYEMDEKQYIQKLQKEYLGWFNNIEQTYVISNLGFADDILKSTLRHTIDKQVFLSAPCIGAQPLTLFFVRTNNQINVSCTIDESRLEKNLVLEVLKEFAVEKIAKMIEELK